jgi:chromatin structure-remodeling complex subunit RSC9
MKSMFVLDPEGELTQVEFFQLYSVTFTPFNEASPLLAPADVIKNVNVVYPSAQALLLPGPPQKFVVRGVTRKQVKLPNQDRYKCQWDRGQCPNPFSAQNPGDLYDHILSAHLTHGDSASGPHDCLWASCTQGPISLKLLRSHALTHIPLTQPFPKHSSQSDVVTLPDPGHKHPVDDPTKRTLVPPREFFIPSSRVAKDPPPMALTALLCIRVLFRTAFASAEAAPRADDDHFGFPGVIDDQDEGQTQQQQVRDAHMEDIEREGELRGRRAFMAVKEMLGEVKIRDETLMGWVEEMVTAGTSG